MFDHLHKATRRSVVHENVSVGDFKHYERFECISLPPAQLPSESLEDVLHTRTSYPQENLSTLRTPSLQKISVLLKYGVGLFEEKGNQRHMFRPSAGGMTPLEGYLLVQEESEALTAGIYHYHIPSHALVRLPFPLVKTTDAPCAIVLTARWQHIDAKYESMAYRYTLLEAGHAMQNMILAATALGIHQRPMGILEAELDSILKITKEKETSLYALPFGSAHKNDKADA